MLKEIKYALFCQLKITGIIEEGIVAEEAFKEIEAKRNDI